MIIAASRDVPWVATIYGHQQEFCAQSDELPDARVLWTGPGYRFELLDRFAIAEADIPAGYVFNAASIPRVLWSVPGLSPLDLGVVSVLVHDWLYARGRGNRLKTDRLFLAHMEAEGIGWWPRYPAYAGAVAFGESHWGGEA